MNWLVGGIIIGGLLIFLAWLKWNTKIEHEDDELNSD